MRILSLLQMRTGIAARVGWLVVVMALYSAVVALVEVYFLHGVVLIHANVEALLALLGSLLAILLVFRTNTAYDRWWEGRKLWGQLINDSRNLCIKVRALAKVDRQQGQHLGRLLLNFARALKEHLREGIRSRQLSIYRNVKADPKHVPLHIATLVREEIGRWRDEKRIDGFDELLLDVHSRALMDICGSCERIRRTPIAPSYLAFIRQSIAAYLVTLPWGLVDQFGFWSVLIVVVVAYFMIGIEFIAEDVEEPFGRGENDLLLDELCQNLENSINEIFEKKPTLQPADSGGEPSHVIT